MVSEIKDLLIMQQELDDYITESKGLQDYDPTVRLSNTIHALMVEVAELSNEVNAFKYWSNKGPGERHKIIEEYIDVLHFVLSVGNQLKIDAETISVAYCNKNMKNRGRQDRGY